MSHTVEYRAPATGTYYAAVALVPEAVNPGGYDLAVWKR